MPIPGSGIFKAMIELRCSRELALKLGAIEPVNVQQHRELRDAVHLEGMADRIRDHGNLLSSEWSHAALGTILLAIAALTFALALGQSDE